MSNNILSKVPVNNYNISKDEIYKYFLNTWDLSEILYNTIYEEKNFFVKSDKLRHPLMFYYIHITVFYVNKLYAAGIIKKRINPLYEKCFAEGVDPSCPNELIDMKNLPSYKEVKEYRKKVFKIVENYIQNNNFNDYIHQESPQWALLMSMEHDRIHFETSSMLIRQHPTHFLKKPSNWEYAPVSNNEIEQCMVAVSGRNVIIGKPQGASYYGWDNEYGFNNIDVESFFANRYLTTNKEFMLFIKDGGYNNKKLWTKEGWEWRSINNVQYPKFWILEGRDYKYRTIFEEIEMPVNWPVEVNYFEAIAYCQWLGSGARLMTESEYELFSQCSQIKGEPFLEGDYNINMKFGSPSSVDYFDQDGRKFGDIYGNVLQWIDTNFYPLPGFRPHYLYINFSYPYFTSEHSILKGGSWASTGTSASKYYRLWFRKHFYQHAGFRVVK